MLEKAGFIKLKKNTTPFTASTHNIEQYIKPVKIVELDSSLVTRVRKEFDAYSTWSSKVLEADINRQKTIIFSEDGDSHHANIIVVNSKRVNDPAIKASVIALRSDKVKKFIAETYKGIIYSR